jgi:uncharacterized protein
MKTIAVFLHPGKHWNPDLGVREQEYWDEHARFMDALFDAGQIILAGPFADSSGSMVILNCEGTDAARMIFQEDPWAKQDILVAREFREWNIFLDGRDRTEE